PGPGGQQPHGLQDRLRPAAADSIAGSAAGPKLVCPPTTQLDQPKGEPGERDDHRHGKRADREGLVATGAATRRAWRWLENVGQEQERRCDPRPIQEGRPSLTVTAAPDEQGNGNDQPD